MTIHRLTLLLVLFLIPCSSSFAQQISHRELVEILGIKSWRVPMPGDEKWEWSIEIVDSAPRKFTAMNRKRLNPQKRALLVLRDKGNDIYEFTLKQRAGTSQGELEIQVCSEAEIKENRCDDSYSIDWHDKPKPYGDGTRFLIADIAHMVTKKPSKQIIIEPVQYRQ